MFGPLDARHGPGWSVHNADCIERMNAMPPDSVDSIVTDPPYHLTSVQARYKNTSTDRDGTNETRARNRSDAMARLAGGFMGKTWDGGDVAFRVETWRAALRVLKPGGYIFAFASSRGYHRMACAIEDAGFITHPMIGWCFGSGFPKASNASRMIDQALGVKGEAPSLSQVNMMVDGDGKIIELLDVTGTGYQPVTAEAAEWNGWYYGGQARKPALEPIYVGQKPFSEKNGALNILRWGVGAVNIDGCRVGDSGATTKARDVATRETTGIYGNGLNGGKIVPVDLGRWPANLIHDGSPEVVALFPHTISGGGPAVGTKRTHANTYNEPNVSSSQPYGSNSGSAARFFNCYPPDIPPLIYSPKASSADRLGSKHPTVKPQKLMRDIIKHGTPPGGTILDPFAGTGSTLKAAVMENRHAIGIEADPTSVVDTVWRMTR